MAGVINDQPILEKALISSSSPTATVILIVRDDDLRAFLPFLPDVEDFRRQTQMVCIMENQPVKRGDYRFFDVVISVPTVRLRHPADLINRGAAQARSKNILLFVI